MTSSVLEQWRHIAACLEESGPYVTVLTFNVQQTVRDAHNFLDRVLVECGDGFVRIWKKRRPFRKSLQK